MSDSGQYRANIVTLMRWAAEQFDIAKPLRVLEVGVVPHAFRAQYGATTHGSVFERCLKDREQKIGTYVLIDRDPAVGADIVWDMEEPFPFPELTYDVVVASEVLEHSTHPRVVLRALHERLTPGGSIVVTVPFMWREHRPKPDLWRFTPEGLRLLLIDAGFEVHDERAFQVGNVVANLGGIARSADRATEE